MKIHVRLYGNLRDLLPAEQKGRTTLELAAGSTAADILAQLGVDPFALIAINNEHDSDHDRPLQDGDRLDVFMPVAGGSCHEVHNTEFQVPKHRIQFNCRHELRGMIQYQMTLCPNSDSFGRGIRPRIP